ncbi:hypothetical protein SAMN04488093_107103 [Tropicibacter naphthalenivorans]|uniref:Uncharacterized protein n=1 Tax=Tropicibacter naphthalenivorans TaxID=441103 RepID=A0A0P1GTW4_9RHOB|nr:hypothetical protein [Tropicibacter naphthalenivorans]CUH77998.1 hypothetical protein TRN7648_01739 [Tropicibacter naphthalenivorans]SMC94302.1 hypothetical protein SAMN04488093_107103 [Tropicibacter naphthalenivorans]
MAKAPHIPWLCEGIFAHRAMRRMAAGFVLAACSFVPVTFAGFCLPKGSAFVSHDHRAKGGLA